MHAPRFRVRVALLATAAALLTLHLGACSSSANPGGDVDGPGGSGVTTAEPPAGASVVDRDTACEVAASSAGLNALGAVGEPADTDFIVALSYCQLELTGLEGEGESVSVEILAAADVILTAQLDPAAFSGTLVPLPDLGENGHFVSLRTEVDPATNPDAGAISATRGELGVTFAWATRGPILTFTEYEQIVRELLEALP
ncbi:MAG: hypothetical protein U1E32_12930 [Rhodoglobus sp.]|nr:hypothetical protein [Rhodoglobus sp.]